MNSGSWLAEREAYQSFTELLAQAEKCRILFDRASIAIPEPLKRLLGTSDVFGRGPQRALIPPPERNSPPEGSPEWISIDLKDAITTSIVLCVLRGNHPQPMRPKDVAARVEELRPEISSGTIANIGGRLDGKQIRRSQGLWGLIRPEQGAVLHQGRLWGDAKIFDKYELASHRREAILHVLRYFPTGLQNLQILEQLKNLSWLHAPLTKDLVKEDMNALLTERLVRRRGNTRKWEPAPTRERGGRAQKQKGGKANAQEGNGPGGSFATPASGSEE
jgi:hypothetical protein